MFDCSKIKLIIWDLDDTFWEGTLSEGEIQPVERNVRLVKELTERGIVNSICSKNDWKPAEEQLKKIGIWEYFVFPSVSWEPKGERIRQTLEDMKLRSQNVLFLDDNPINLNEAVFYNEGIMIGTPDDITALEQFTSETEATDQKHKRLLSYRLLEEKQEAQKKSGSNAVFLKESNIKVVIHEDCMSELDRIAEMIQRTNQLNYTKKRIDRAETEKLFQDPHADCGYVTVEDKYGSYGIVGFYAKRNQGLEHFLFSCRTLGMGVEQYVYAVLGYPVLKTEGDVAVLLKKNFQPDWINQEKELVQEGRAILGNQQHRPKILFKGPCDLNSIFAFIEESENIDCEFTYVNSQTGVTIEQISHTAHTVQSLTLTKEQKQRVIQEIPFGDPEMYSDRIFSGNYDVVCLSILVDANLGVYRRRETGELVAFGEGYYPLTNSENWEKYIHKEIYTAGCSFNRKMLEEFAEKYEFAGIYDADQVAKDLVFIREHLPADTLMIIVLGVEIPYEKNKLPAYRTRHKEHQKMNERIKTVMKQYPNIDYIDVNRYVKGQESFYDQFNHFVPAVYYEMSKDIVRLVEKRTDLQLEGKSRLYMHVETWKENMRKIKHQILK